MNRFAAALIVATSIALFAPSARPQDPDPPADQRAVPVPTQTVATSNLGTGHVVLSPDGRWALILADFREQGATLWRLDGSGGMTHTAAFEGSLQNAAAFSADSRWFVIGSRDAARLWRIDGENAVAVGKVGADGESSGMVIAAAFSPDGRRLLTGGPGGLNLWKLDGAGGSSRLTSLAGHTGMVNDVAFSPDGEWAVSGSTDESARLWHCEADGARAAAVLAHGDHVHAVAFSPDGRFVLTGAQDAAARLWLLDGKGGAELKQTCAHTGPVSSVAFWPDGSRAITAGSREAAAHLWKLDGQGGMTADVSLPDVARNVAVSADGAWLLASSYNIGSGIVRLWHMAGAIDTPGCRVLVGPDREVTRVAISGDATIIAAGDKASTTHIWKLGTTGEATALPRLTRPDGYVSLLAFDSGERLLCGTGSIRGGDLKVYSVDTNANATSVTGSCPELLRTGPTSLRPLAVSPDGKWLFASVDGMDGTLWQIDDKHATQAPGQISHSHVILDAAFSADGNWLLTGSIDKTARLWRLDGKGAADRAMELRHPSTVASVAFSPDSSWAATGSVDGTVRLWRISAAGTPAATCTATLGQHSAHVWAIAFSADGNRLLTGSGDQTARLWQLDGKGAATVIRTLRGHTRDVSSVALSKDGHLALTGSADKTVRVWSLGD